MMGGQRPAMVSRVRRALRDAGIICPVSVRFVGMTEVDTGDDADVRARVQTVLAAAGFVADLEQGRAFVFERGTR